jgi:hypothetical protein
MTTKFSPISILNARSLALQVALSNNFECLHSLVRSAFTLWIESDFSQAACDELVSAAERFDINGFKVASNTILTIVRFSEIQAVLRGNGSKLGEYAPESNSDDLKSDFLFSLSRNALLIAICNGQVDPVMLAARELANRGYGLANDWIGFEMAKEYDYFVNRK